jgi:hypothetical protein
VFRFPVAIYTNLPLLSLASKYKKQKMAWWSLGMTLVTLVVFAWKADGFQGFFLIAFHFLTGDLAAVKETNTAAIPVITASVVISVPLALTLLPLLEKIFSKQTEPFRLTSSKRFFALIMVTMFLEELLTRYVPLDMMTRFSLLSGTLAFYLLYIGGNTLWSLLHMVNFADKRENWVMVIPVFVCGTFYTMIYTAYGFWAAFFSHVLHNMVMLSANCRIHFLPSRLVLSVYHLGFLGIYSLVFFGVRNHSFADFQLVLENKEINWGLIDYLTLVGALTAAVFFLLELFWYDLERTGTQREYLLNLVWISLLLLITAFPAISLADVHFQEHKLFIAVGIAVGITFIEKTKSGSGISRLFWKSQLLSVVLIITPIAENITSICLFLPLLLHQLGERMIRLNYIRNMSTLDYFWYAALHSSKMPLRQSLAISLTSYVDVMIKLKIQKNKKRNN